MFRLSERAERAHEDAAWSVAWCGGEEGPLVVTASVDESVRVWDASDLARGPLHTLREEHALPVVSVAASHCGARVVTSSMDGVLRVFAVSAESASLERQMEAGAVETWTVAAHPSRPLVATGSHSGAVHVWNYETGEREATYEGGESFALSVAFSPDGRLLASGGHDGGVHVFEAETGNAVHKKLAGHRRPVRALAFSADSATLYTGSEDSFVNEYDMGSGEQKASMSGHQAWVLAATASRDGERLVTSSSDRRIKVWDTRTHECLHTYDSHSDQVWGVAFNPAGTRIASVGDDRSLQIHDCHSK